MNAVELQRNFPPGEAVPESLRELLAFANEAGDWFSGHFQLTSWPYGDAAWFDGDAKAARQFPVFGRESDGALYAFWLYPGRTLATAPVVYLGSEGMNCSVLADNADEFLALLAAGAEDLGFGAGEGGITPADEPAPRLGDFRDWLLRSFGIVAPADPMAVITAARTRHPDLDGWLDAWGASHFGS